MEMEKALPVILSVSAMLVYAIIQVMLKQFSSKYNVFVLYVSYAPLQFAVMYGMLMLTRTSHESFAFPVGWEWQAIIIVGFLFALGTSLNYLSFVKGGSVTMITCATLLLPVFATAINFARTWEAPNLWQVGGFAAGVVMVFMLVKGNLVQAASKMAVAQ